MEKSVIEIISDDLKEDYNKKHPEERQKEAKWLSDLETLKKHYFKFKRNSQGYLIKDTRENAEKYMRVSIENSDRFVDEENEKIRLQKESPKGIREEVLTLLLLKKKDQASELIVKEIKKNNYIYTTKDDIKPEIWIYNNGIYVPQGKSEIEKQVRDLLGEAFTITLSNEILHKIRADTQIEIDEFFKINYLDEIPVENGILNIKTRELKTFNPERVFFNKVPITYNPKAICPNILTFFNDVLKHESDVPVILELFGFAMLKEYRYEKAFMFVGNGRNGKSKTIELLKRMLGIENCCSVPLSMITADSTSVCELFGKMVNLAGDLSNDSLKKTGMFKQTVGRDLISAKRKYLRDLPFINYAKHIFACNELPRVYDLSDGFWTKWVLLEFPYKFIPQKEFDELSEDDKKNKKILDTDIIEKITTPEEMSGLLNLALDSLDKLILQKDFSYSVGTSQIKNFWIRQSDSFTAFCMDMLVEDYNEKISQKLLRREYNHYCRKNKLKGCGDKLIKAVIEDRYGAVYSQNWEDKQRYWEGVKLKNNQITSITTYS